MNTFDDKAHRTAEFARPIPWQPEWEPNAPTPQVFSNGHRTFLIYLIDEPAPNWGGTNISLPDNTNETSYPLALVEFSGSTFRFGIANDEVFSGLLLSNRGLRGYGAHIIENSGWIAEIKAIHKVHPYYREERWKDEKHYILLFKDEILEVIATGYHISAFNSTFKQLAMEVAKRMNA